MDEEYDMPNMTGHQLILFMQQ